MEINRPLNGHAESLTLSETSNSSVLEDLGNHLNGQSISLSKIEYNFHRIQIILGMQSSLLLRKPSITMLPWC